MEIISGLKESGLIGLGGAGFPTWKKWQAVKEAENPRRFLVCNLSEGEPGVFKDEYILQNHANDLVSGVRLAASTIKAVKSYIFINDKYNKYFRRLKSLVRGGSIEIYVDTGRYLCGEETTLLQVIEGKLRQPRQKPPYPSQSGLYGYPTLINNAETLYRAYLISQGGGSVKRFYSLSGDLVNRRIVEEKIRAKISEIIPEWIAKKTNFFRVGGASGCFYPANSIGQIVDGTGSIEIFSKKRRIIEGLADSIKFLLNESCGKCTPCREGIYRIAEEINKLVLSSSFWDKNESIDKMLDIAEATSVSSFCPLGSSVLRPVSSAITGFREELING